MMNIKLKLTNNEDILILDLNKSLEENIEKLKEQGNEVKVRRCTKEDFEIQPIYNLLWNTGIYLGEIALLECIEEPDLKILGNTKFALERWKEEDHLKIDYYLLGEKYRKYSEIDLGDGYTNIADLFIQLKMFMGDKKEDIQKLRDVNVKIDSGSLTFFTESKEEIVSMWVSKHWEELINRGTTR